jgi:hypothetical protein
MRQQALVYLDEDVDVLLVTLLRARGYDAEHAKDCGLLGESDESQLRYAIETNRALLTHNRQDFEALAEALFERGESHAGIIIAGRRPVHELARRALLLLSGVGADGLINQIRYI